jgi:hypothetical protein
MKYYIEYKKKDKLKKYYVGYFNSSKDAKEDGFWITKSFTDENIEYFKIIDPMNLTTTFFWTPYFSYNGYVQELRENNYIVIGNPTIVSKTIRKLFKIKKKNISIDEVENKIRRYMNGFVLRRMAKDVWICSSNIAHKWSGNAKLTIK